MELIRFEEIVVWKEEVAENNVIRKITSKIYNILIKAEEQ